jgi:hypothetical protein
VRNNIRFIASSALPYEIDLVLVEHRFSKLNIIFKLQSGVSASMDRNAVEAFLVALFLLSAFAVARARGGKDKVLTLLVISAFMGSGSVIGFVFGYSAKDEFVGAYLAFELMWALGSIAAVGRIRRNRRFAKIYATGVA